MSQATNCCTRCGQALNLVDEPLAEFQAIQDNGNQLCLQCYQDLCDQSF